MEDDEPVGVLSAGGVEPELTQLLFANPDKLVGAELFRFDVSERVNDENVAFEFRCAFRKIFLREVMMRQKPVDAFKALIVLRDGDVQQLVVATEFNTDSDFERISRFPVLCQVVPLVCRMLRAETEHFDIRGGIVNFRKDKLMYPVSPSFVEQALYGKGSVLEAERSMAIKVHVFVVINPAIVPLRSFAFPLGNRGERGPIGSRRNCTRCRAVF